MSNILRRLRGLPTQSIETAYDRANAFIDDLISPAPASRNAANLYSASIEQTEAVALDSLERFSKGNLTQQAIDVASDYVPTIGAKGRQIVLDSTPLNTIAKMIEKEFPKLAAVIEELFKLIQQKVAERKMYLAATRALSKKLRKYVFHDRKGKAARPLFNGAVAFSTQYKVDPTKPKSYYEGYKLTHIDANGKAHTQIFSNAEERDAARKKLLDAWDVQNAVLRKAGKVERKPRTYIRNESKEQLDDWEELQTKYWRPLQKMQGGKTGKYTDAYVELRDAYAKVFDDLKQALLDRIASIEADDDLKEAYKDKILYELLLKENIEPYFPLFRVGTHWLIYEHVDSTGQSQVYKELWASDFKRNRRMRELRADTELNRNLARAGKKLIFTMREEEGELQFTADNISEEFAYSLLGDVRARIEQRSNLARDKVIDAGGTEAEADKARMDSRAGQRDVENIVLEAILNASPERGLLRQFRKREGTMGYEQDAITVLEKRMPAFAQQIVNIKHDVGFNKIQNKISDIADAYQENYPNTYPTQIGKQLLHYIQFNRNPSMARWSRNLKSAGFAWTLGINVSSMLVNLFIIPFVVLPYLGGMYGYGNVMKALVRNTKLYLGTGLQRELVGFEGGLGITELEGPTLTHIDFSDAKKARGYEQFETLAAVMQERGLDTTSFIADMLDMDNPNSSLLTKINAGMGLMFHQGERLTRQVTAMTAYELALKKKGGVAAIEKQSNVARDEAIKAGKTKAEAEQAKKASQATQYEEMAEYAILETEHTNAGALTETAPKYAQTDWGSVLLMYKRFGVSMLYVQMRMFRQAFAHGIAKGNVTREEAWIAKKQLVGTYLIVGLFAGAQGVPMLGTIRTIYNAFIREDDEDDWDSMVIANTSLGFNDGILNLITGMDIAPRIGMTSLLYRAFPNQEQEDVMMQVMEIAGGPIFGIATRMFGDYGGVSLIQDGEYMRGIEKMMPAAISAGMKGIRYSPILWGEGGARTLRGDPIVDDLSTTSLMGQFFGFAPAGVTRQIEENARAKGQDRAIATEKSSLLRDLYMENRLGDRASERKTRRKIRAFNRRHPETAITRDTIKRSFKQHKATDIITKQFGGITISPNRRPTVVRERVRLLGEEGYFNWN